MKIDIVDVQEMLENDPHMLLVDVRTQEEFDAGHIPGAGCMPVETIMDCLYDEALSERGLDAIAQARGMEMADDASVIVLYCRSGARSVTAAQYMEAIGYVNVYDAGGINEWPYEVVTTEEERMVAAGIAASGMAAVAEGSQGGHDDGCCCGHEDAHTHSHAHECGCGHDHAHGHDEGCCD